jgi:hypothetical protein
MIGWQSRFTSPDSGSGDRSFESFLASHTTTCVVSNGIHCYMLWIGWRSSDPDRASGTYPLVR